MRGTSPQQGGAVSDPRPVGLDLYAVLGVAPSAGAAEIAGAYRRRVREVHPDTRERTVDTPDVQADLRAVQEAYLVLRDPVRRAEYDAECRAHDPERRPRGVPVPVRVRRRPAPVREVLLRAGPVRVDPLPRRGPS
jgi:DnaJ-domain-containing protein 1